jgi:hypothetical protein
MGELVFRCKKTGAEFNSGFRAEPSELASLPADAKLTLRCRVCGERHEFKLAEALIREEPGE